MSIHVHTVQAPSEETSQYTGTGAVWILLGKILYTPLAAIPEQSSESNRKAMNRNWCNQKANQIEKEKLIKPEDQRS